MRVPNRFVSSAMTLALAAAPWAFAQQPRPSGAPPGAGAPAPGPAKAGTEAALLPAEPVVTQHSVKIGGQAVSYTAEAGFLPIRDDGKLVAKMFYVAYAKNGVTDSSSRPLIFSFNGGPGTASVWMHMGYTGPRRVVYDDDGFAQRPPIALEDNPHSILDTADIVYIDPVGTGFSRMLEGEDVHKFHGKLADIQSVGDFIHAFLARKDRWASPKFVIGESYGTTRAAGLAGSLLNRFQIYLNGVILVSMTSLDVERGQDVASAFALPQRAATAWYHRQLAAELQKKPLKELLAEVEAFAAGEYLAALAKGDRLSDAEGNQVAQKLGRYMGVSGDYVRSANLRVDARRYWKELLRDQRLTLGRLDSRYLGIDRDAAGEGPEYDPALADWNGPFANAVNRYLRSELRYNPELQYNVWGNVRPWAQDEGTSVAELLREAMRGNPYLKVLIQGGYYDAATDYFNAVYTISHIQPGGEFKDRFRYAWYESGHMMYLRKADLANSNDDLRSFIRWSLEGAKDYPRRAKPPATP